ncbi:DUF268 domain-containing protein [Devosia ginsengisoli]|uniref:DUF268 domain-containing protein n=1 Tax=Devosia ginsengisoli TaxID=400770 RepID=UPI0026EFA558|nr:DUF268 domain-containing protein [Devosia ginsengisoli]MCR6672065.1 DUF268 domain-containing protein [Devosia ginsengisoli]
MRTLAYWAFTANKKGLLNPLVLGRTVGYMPKFMGQFQDLKNDAGSRGVAIKIKDVFPVALDYSVNHVNRHYWFQDIHVAQKVIDGSRGKPDHLHIDIGSRIEGFILALIAARINLVFGEINMPKIAFENTELRFIDLQNMSPEQFAGATSVSCLHVIEHLGLGKYGDAIDALGHFKVFSDFARVLGPGVPLYVSSPTSNEPGVVFNAGRHLDPVEMYQEAEKAGFTVLEKAFVTSAWSLLIDPSDEEMRADPYGCLILTLIKR